MKSSIIGASPRSFMWKPSEKTNLAIKIVRASSNRLRERHFLTHSRKSASGYETISCPESSLGREPMMMETPFALGGFLRSSPKTTPECSGSPSSASHRLHRHAPQNTQSVVQQWTPTRKTEKRESGSRTAEVASTAKPDAYSFLQNNLWPISILRWAGASE